MKNLYAIFLMMLAAVTLTAQAPQGINYQAVARDGSGDILTNQTIDVRFSIRQGSTGGTVVYQEEHGTSTNDFGLFTAQIGQGDQISGNFSSIGWGANDHYLQVEVDDGSGYEDMGTTQFMSAPYALYAEEAGSGGGSSPWSTSGSDVYYEAGDVGIGTSSPSYPLEVQGALTDGNLVHLEASSNSANYDLLELEVASSVTSGQFIEFQRENNIVGSVDVDGSASFLNLTVDEDLPATSSPEKGRLYANALPVAYAEISGGGSVSGSSFGIASSSSPSTGEYIITLDNSLVDDPVVLVTAFNSTPDDEIATYEPMGASPNQVKVNISNGNGTPITSAFSILIFGEIQ